MNDSLEMTIQYNNDVLTGQQPDIHHIHRLCIEAKSHIFNNKPQGSQLRGRPKYRWWKCVQTDINTCKIKTWKEVIK